ncbi:MAG: hypothetical protein E6J01_06780 [Chloroflexi bacterium]|nr:MAG: hypothetical protein E6J01_06780 [Chloroflexota bacterium]
MVVLIALAIGSTDSGSGSRQNRSDRPATSTDGPKHISGSQWFGCSDREYFEKLVGYAVDKDNEAFKRGLAAGVVAGNCTLFKNGEAVYTVDTAIFSGLVKVRRRGETQEYWTNLEAVD